MIGHCPVFLRKSLEVEGSPTVPRIPVFLQSLPLPSSRSLKVTCSFSIVWKVQRVCTHAQARAHTQAQTHSSMTPAHPSAQTAFLKEAFEATPAQSRPSCFTPHRLAAFPSELLHVIICLSPPLSIKSGIIVSLLYPQTWQDAWRIEGVLE